MEELKMEKFDIDRFVRTSVNKLEKNKKPLKKDDTILANHDNTIRTSIDKTGFENINNRYWHR